METTIKWKVLWIENRDLDEKIYMWNVICEKKSKDKALLCLNYRWKDMLYHKFYEI